MATLDLAPSHLEPEAARQAGGHSHSHSTDIGYGSLAEERGLSRNPQTDDAAESSFSIAQFLLSEQQKDLLRLSTAGSVDDGKSTLIGRLLYDSRNVYEDHVRAVTKTRGGSAQSSIDFAQLTDGLRAEREQGITIDVAYRYFSTERRKFIIADTPGHEQYTRNMATGASTADLAVILIDASKGILTQSRRHVYITSLLGIRHLVAAINKMDLVDFSQEVFSRIERQFSALVRQLGNAKVKAIPLSALGGDNVVEPSVNMPWYTGPTLLEHLEAVPTRHQLEGGSFRLPVQRVIRPHHNYPQQNFRGFAGQIAAGTVRVGDRVVAMPSGRTTRIASICTFDGDLEQASAPQSIAVTLEGEFDISRGDFLASADHPPRTGTAIEASLVWFDGNPLDRARSYLLKHSTQTMGARIRAIHHRVNMQTLERETVDSLAMNDIAQVEIETLRPIFFDPYEQNRTTGSFILIDPDTNATAAAGMIQGAAAVIREGSGATFDPPPAILVTSDAALAVALETALLDGGSTVVRTRRDDPVLWRTVAGVGAIVLVELPGQPAGVHLATAQDANEAPRFEALRLEGSEQSAVTAAEIVNALRARGILPGEKRSGTA